MKNDNKIYQMFNDITDEKEKKITKLIEEKSNDLNIDNDEKYFLRFKSKINEKNKNEGIIMIKNIFRKKKNVALAALMGALVITGCVYANDIYEKIEKINVDGAFKLEEENESIIEKVVGKRLATLLDGKLYDKEGKKIEEKDIVSYFNDNNDGYDSEGNKVLGFRFYNKKGVEVFPTENPILFAQVKEMTLITTEKELEEYKKILDIDEKNEDYKKDMTLEELLSYTYNFKVRVVDAEKYGYTKVSATNYGESKDYLAITYENKEGKKISLHENVNSKEAAFETSISKDTVKFDLDGSTCIWDRKNKIMYISYKDATVTIIAKDLTNDEFRSLVDTIK